MDVLLLPWKSARGKASKRQLVDIYSRLHQNEFRAPLQAQATATRRTQASEWKSESRKAEQESKLGLASRDNKAEKQYRNKEK